MVGKGKRCVWTRDYKTGQWRGCLMCSGTFHPQFWADKPVQSALIRNISTLLCIFLMFIAILLVSVAQFYCCFVNFSVYFIYVLSVLLTYQGSKCTVPEIKINKWIRECGFISKLQPGSGKPQEPLVSWLEKICLLGTFRLLRVSII